MATVPLPSVARVSRGFWAKVAVRVWLSLTVRAMVSLRRLVTAALLLQALT